MSDFFASCSKFHYVKWIDAAPDGDAPCRPDDERKHYGSKSRQRGSPAAWRPRAAMARRPYDAPRRVGHRSGRSSLRTRRVSKAACASVLVPVLRCRHGHGLAFLRYHHERHRCIETRSDPACRRAGHPCLRRPRPALPQDAGRTHIDWRSGRFRWRRIGRSEPPRRQGRQCRRSGRLRSLPARFHRHGRCQVGGRPAGHERRPPAGEALSLALGGPDKLPRRAA